MIEVETLGRTGLRAADGRELQSILVQPKRFALLIYLILGRPRGLHRRDTLLGLFWGDRDQSRARKSLRQALYVLRRGVGAGVVVGRGNDEVGVAEKNVRCDAILFEAALDRDDPEEALAHYQGELLEGFYLSDAAEFERWLDAERSRLLARAVAAAVELSQGREAEGAAQEAVRWARWAAARAPYDETVLRHRMELLARAGDRAAAVAAYEEAAGRMEEELGVEPSADTQALGRRLRTGGGDGGAPGAGAEPPADRVGGDEGEAAGDEGAAAGEGAAADGEGEAAGDEGAAAGGKGAAAGDEGAAAGGKGAAAGDEGAAAAGLGVGAGGEGTAPAGATDPASERRPRWWSWGGLWGRVAVGLAVLISVAALGFMLLRPGGGSDDAVIVAVGDVRSYEGTDARGLARALPEMLAMNLARVQGLQVLSTSRLYEVLAQLGGEQGGTAAVARAARRAGADEIIEARLHGASDGRYALDVQRIDLGTGVVQAAFTVRAPDLPGLAGAAAERIARAAGLHRLGGELGNVSTASATAYRFYNEGLRTYYQGDRRGAQRFFAAAVEADSTFAMAWYYLALSNQDLDHEAFRDHLRRAVRHAHRATDRERLLIEGAWAREMHEPRQVALAETLSVRYPAEPDGHYLYGNALLWRGDFLAAVPHLRRVIEMDSLSLTGDAGRCLACDAFWDLVTAYRLADSLEVAEAVARRWIGQQPSSARAWHALASMLAYLGRSDEALIARSTAASLRKGNPRDIVYPAVVALRDGDFATADRLLHEYMDHGSPLVRQNALWYATLSLRYQRRFEEALAMARRYRDAVEGASVPAQREPFQTVLEAIVLLEMGRADEAAVVFEGMADYPYEPESPARNARHKAWVLTHAASARAAAGDTAGLLALADSIQVLGNQSAYGRDPRLHHYVRGLLHAARGEHERAVSDYRRARFSPNTGYGRINLELGRSLLALDRPAEAAAVLEAAFRGPLDASNLYVNHTTLHQLLARAYEEAGDPDSAARHRRWVVDARGAPQAQDSAQVRSP